MGEHKRNKKSQWYKARHPKVEEEVKESSIDEPRVIEIPDLKKKIKDFIKCRLLKQKK